MGRPTGVTVIAVLYFIAASFCVLGGIGVILGGGFIATMMSQSGGQGAGAGAGLLAGLGAVLGIFLLIGAGLAILIAMGLLKLKNWARIIAIVFAGLGVLGGLFALIGILSHMAMFGLVWTVCRLAINAWIIYYLLQPPVAAAFTAGQTRGATA